MTIAKRVKDGEIVLPYVMREAFKRPYLVEGNASDIERALLTKDVAVQRIKELRRLITFSEDDIPQFSTTESKDDYRDFFHPSSAGSCSRSMFFGRLGAPTDDTNDNPESFFRKTMIFFNGDMVHLRWMIIFDTLGIMESRETPFVDKKDFMCCL